MRVLSVIHVLIVIVALTALAVIIRCGYVVTTLISQPRVPIKSHSCSLYGESPDTYLPDPACTPGVVATTDLQAVCKPGYSESVRPPESWSEHEKWDVIWPEYGNPAWGELDHLIPLELGGSPTARGNLWPEPGAVPNLKDAVENRLHEAVCSGQVGLTAAQLAIAINWTTAERSLGIASR